MCEHLRGVGRWQIYYFIPTLLRSQSIRCIIFFCSSKKCIFGKVQSSQWKAIKWHAHTQTATTTTTTKKNARQLAFLFRVTLEWLWTFYYLCYLSSAYIKWHLYRASNFIFDSCLSLCVCVSKMLHFEFNALLSFVANWGKYDLILLFLSLQNEKPLVLLFKFESIAVIYRIKYETSRPIRITNVYT